MALPNNAWVRSVVDLGLPEIGWQRAQVEVVGGQTIGRFGPRTPYLGRLHVHFDGGDDPLRDFVL